VLEGEERDLPVGLQHGVLDLRGVLDSLLAGGDESRSRRMWSSSGRPSAKTSTGRPVTAGRVPGRRHCSQASPTVSSVKVPTASIAPVTE